MLFADTSVWSLALRRDASPEGPQVQRLREALSGGEAVHTTGIVLQELLQGYRGPRAGAPCGTLRRPSADRPGAR